MNYYALSSAARPASAAGEPLGIGAAAARAADGRREAQRRDRRSPRSLVTLAVRRCSGPLIIATPSTRTSGTATSAACCDRRRSCSAIYLVGLVASYVQTQTMGGVGRACCSSCATRSSRSCRQLPVDVLQPEQGRRPDLAHQQRHRQAEPVLLAGADAVRRQPVPDDRRRRSSCWRSTCGSGWRRWCRRSACSSSRGCSRPGSSARTSQSLQTLGGMSARDPGEPRAISRSSSRSTASTTSAQKFDDANEQNYAASVGAGIANNIFMPIYGLAYNLGAARRAGLRHLAHRARAS